MKSSITSETVSLISWESNKSQEIYGLENTAFLQMSILSSSVIVIWFWSTSSLIMPIIKDNNKNLQY